MSFWLIQSLNSLALGGVLFTLAAGFSLIFGLMRIANLSHGAYFMLGAYVGLSVVEAGHSFFLALIASALAIGLLGLVVERVILRRLAGNSLSQVLATLGVAFVIADGSLWFWGGDPRLVSAPSFLSGGIKIIGQTFPLYRVALVVFSIVVALGLWLLLDKTKLGVMIRASVDDRQMAQGIGTRYKTIFNCFLFGLRISGYWRYCRCTHSLRVPRFRCRYAAISISSCNTWRLG